MSISGAARLLRWTAVALTAALTFAVLVRAGPGTVVRVLDLLARTQPVIALAILVGLLAPLILALGGYRAEHRPARYAIVVGVVVVAGAVPLGRYPHLVPPSGWVGVVALGVVLALAAGLTLAAAPPPAPDLRDPDAA